MEYYPKQHFQPPLSEGIFYKVLGNVLERLLAYNDKNHQDLCFSSQVDARIGGLVYSSSAMSLISNLSAKPPVGTLPQSFDVNLSFNGGFISTSPRWL